jgi:protein-tyrosine phosphatase
MDTQFSSAPDAPRFIDIHCHLLPGIDDGSNSWEESLQMARMAVADGFQAIICTPHQMGGFAHNHGPAIRQRVDQLQSFLREHSVPLQVAAGADVRIDQGLLADLRSGKVLSLGDRGRHVLLELPHEMYFPLEPVLDELASAGLIGILSHPERNHGILKQREVLLPLVERGCLMQVTCGSLLGTFGPRCQEFSQWMLSQGLVHFLASDAHGSRSRRPLMRRAYERVAELVDQELAGTLCCRNPAAVWEGRATTSGLQRVPLRKASWLPWRRAA